MTRFHVYDPTCEYRSNPLGIGVQQPRLSWKLESDRRGTMQTAYCIEAASEKDGFHRPLWTTGIRRSGDSIQVPYEGPPLASRQRVYYRIKAWDNYGRESEWSEAAWWETGLLSESDWEGAFITPDAAAIDPNAEAAYMLRLSFQATNSIARARVYATAAGVYELYLNGERVSRDLLAPGWTSYSHRLQYQAHDVTGLVREGGNGIGVLLGDGWYRSGMGFEGKNFKYGDRRAALVQLHLQFEDGTEEIVASGPSWKAALAPIRYSSIYHGETYDARLELERWSEADFEDSSWSAAVTVGLPLKTLVAQENWPTRVTETIKPVSAFVTPAGDHVLDMGQNMVGRMRMTVEAPAGARIVLRHAEVLDRDGNIYFGNLRSARQQVEYIAKGSGREEYAPHFTFQGFRYVQVEGYPGQEGGLPLEAFAGEVMHSDMPRTGEFECSDERLNRLQSNIQWGQRGNFLDVPTDCPQRDERLGWTGDAQVFIGTALFNYQGGPFFTKWLRDLKAEQLPDGGVPFVIPDTADGSSSAAWGDAAVICPWKAYRYYGDTRLLAEQYGSMKAWVEYIRAQGDREELWNTGFHFGDWLALDAKEDSYVGATPLPLVATACYAYSARLLSEAAGVLGYEEDAAAYRRLQAQISQAFRDEFVTQTGRIAAPTQTAHVLALVFDLVDDSLKPRVAQDLNTLIADNGYHLSTGFIGTPYLCFALSENGYHQTAIRLLMQESYPGWLYSVSKGATTIWEHWDSIKPDGSFWSDDMNSFNHYAYGAIGEWMYRKLAGLEPAHDVAAFKRSRIAPMFGARKLTYAKAVHESSYGRLSAGWTVEGEKVEVTAEVPANTAAEVFLQGASLAVLTEGGRPFRDVEGVLEAVEDGSGVALQVGSGSYRFAYPGVNLFRIRYTEESRVDEILLDEAAAAIMGNHFRQLLASPMINFMSRYTLKQLTENAMSGVSPEMVRDLLADLSGI
ncbi:alpha-L-rhamnosidase [Paenibacillus sp. RU4T]|nr:alpha-L-rhamnosidase [Paenibacillus sp. RU4X]SIR72705.1 alpha-L-rhamnosidase [Paenibacillus sp. RU4T]